MAEVQGLVLVSRLINVMRAACAVLASAAALLLAQRAGALDLPTCACALLAGGCLWAAARLADYREATFISGVRAWQRAGGLSLVQGLPVKVPSMPT